MFVSVKYNPHIAKKTKAFLDGKEVTNDCYAANDKKGVVFLYKLDEHGKRYIDPKNPHVAAREIKCGNVELKIGD